jgi:hypothetical protein
MGVVGRCVRPSVKKQLNRSPNLLPGLGQAFVQCLSLSEMVRRGKHDLAAVQPTRRAVSDKPRWREPQGTTSEQRLSMRI